MALLGFEKDERPLRILFLDLNAYFASVEQQEHEQLRGRPVAVAPVMADSTFVIAASYEAKAFGVKTGTRVGDAKLMCPDLQVILATPKLYTTYHKRVVEAVETVLPVEKVHSIDEMECQLLGREREPEGARDLAARVKQAIAHHVGDQLRCSIGIAPNGFLAKIGTELQKPDGLVILTADQLPNALTRLKLTDFPGINRKMRARLQAHGIFTAHHLVNQDPDQLREAFGSVIGERWWYLMRGYEVDLRERERQTLGHSHVLPPELRTDEGSRQVLLRLVQKAAARLRSEGLWTERVHVRVKGSRKSWEAKQDLSATQDSVQLTSVVLKLWETRDFEGPMTVYVTFSGLHARGEFTPSLFDERRDTTELSRAVDEINQKFGKNSVFLAGMSEAKDTASEKIAFRKVELFDEGEA